MYAQSRLHTPSSRDPLSTPRESFGRSAPRRKEFIATERSTYRKPHAVRRTTRRVLIVAYRFLRPSRKPPRVTSFWSIAHGVTVACVKRIDGGVRYGVRRRSPPPLPPEPDGFIDRQIDRVARTRTLRGEKPRVSRNNARRCNFNTYKTHLIAREASSATRHGTARRSFTRSCPSIGGLTTGPGGRRPPEFQKEVFSVFFFSSRE